MVENYRLPFGRSPGRIRQFDVQPFVPVGPDRGESFRVAADAADFHPYVRRIEQPVRVGQTALPNDQRPVEQFGVVADDYPVAPNVDRYDGNVWERCLQSAFCPIV